MRFVLAAALSVGLSGCAIHPIPDDVTRISTYQIVRQIRCETRQSLLEKLALYLATRKTDQEANRLAQVLAGEPDYRSLKGFKLQRETTDMIARFAGSAIAFDYSFDMTEMNNVTASVDLFKAVGIGNVTFGVSGSVDRTRGNVRTFTVSDTFYGLVFQTKNDYCDKYTLKREDKNFAYPIAGRIGMDEVIDNFVDMSLFANLSGEKGAQTTADALSFTTKLAGTLGPKIELLPVRNVSQASLIAMSSRNDIHKVIIGISLPVNGRTAFCKTGILRQLVTVNGTASEQCAANAIQQFIERFDIPKRAAGQFAIQ